MRNLPARLLLLVALLLPWASQVHAQFADQATAITSAGGSANAQTGTLANAAQYADVLNVVLKFTPSATNTGDATLTLNGFGTSPHFAKATASGLTTLVGSELITGQPELIMYNGTYFVLMGPVTLPITAANLASSSLGFGFATNLTVTPSVGSNQLTVALKTAAGADPSASSPVLIPFRDVTIANGDPVVRSLQSALSITITSGNTLGCVSGVICRPWVVAVDNGGTVGLCLYTASSAAAIYPINESALQNSASGTSGGSSAGTYYCNISSVSSKAVRILGYVELTEATAGVWASAPTVTQLFGPGVRRPGDVVQAVFPNLSAIAQAGGTTNVTASITPTSAVNLVRYFVSSSVSVGVGVGGSSSNVTMKRGSTTIGTTAECLITANGVASGGVCPFSFSGYDNPSSVSSQTYVVVVTAGPGPVPGSAGYGATEILEEIMG